MKTPRDLSWRDAVKALSRFGYVVVRQKGSHIRLTTQQGGEDHLAVPAHDPVRVGTLEAIVAKAALHFHKSKSEMMEELFG
jgi:predicted RNA binding protein YcfA (HicA-like mRNA interferase family)